MPPSRSHPPLPQLHLSGQARVDRRARAAGSSGGLAGEGASVFSPLSSEREVTGGGDLVSDGAAIRKRRPRASYGDQVLQRTDPYGENLGTSASLSIRKPRSVGSAKLWIRIKVSLFTASLSDYSAYASSLWLPNNVLLSYRCSLIAQIGSNTLFCQIKKTTICVNKSQSSTCLINYSGPFANGPYAHHTSVIFSVPWLWSVYLVEQENIAVRLCWQAIACCVCNTSTHQPSQCVYLGILLAMDGSSSSKRKAEAQREGESSAKRLNVTVGMEHLDCPICLKPLRPPILQVNARRVVLSFNSSFYLSDKAQGNIRALMNLSLGMVLLGKDMLIVNVT